MTAKKGLYTKMTETEAAYIAGLFDGEGCVSYKQYMRKRKHNKKATSNATLKQVYNVERTYAFINNADQSKVPV